MIKVYSKPDCMPCKMTKKYLTEHNIPFEDVNVEEDEAALEGLKKGEYRTLTIHEVKRLINKAKNGEK